MTRSAYIDAEVRALISEVARQDAAAIGTDEDLVEQLGIDSLQGLEILAGVEKRFDLRLPDEDLVRLRTVGRITDLVQQLRTGARANTPPSAGRSEQAQRREPRERSGAQGRRERALRGVPSARSERAGVPKGVRGTKSPGES